MRIPILEIPEVKWQCPACGKRDVTREIRPHARMHDCPKMAGLTTPFARVDSWDVVKSRLVRVEREDYEAGEMVRRDGNGRPVMAIRTERPDGSNDIHVYAPTATARSSNE